MSMQKAITVAEAKLMINVKNKFIRVCYFKWLNIYFLKSGAKVLQQTAKTCQYVRKNKFLCKKRRKIWSFQKKAVPLHAFSRKILTTPTRWGIKI